jgi:hypothetical protein
LLWTDWISCFSETSACSSVVILCLYRCYSSIDCFCRFCSSN